MSKWNVKCTCNELQQWTLEVHYELDSHCYSMKKKPGPIEDILYTPNILYNSYFGLNEASIVSFYSQRPKCQPGICQKLTQSQFQIVQYRLSNTKIKYLIEDLPVNLSPGTVASKTLEGELIFVLTMQLSSQGSTPLLQ